MITQHIRQYFALCLTACMLPLTGCLDDFVTDSIDTPDKSDAVTYTASVAMVGSAISRAAYDPYEPLVLSSDEDTLYLYLHTYEHPMEDNASASDAQANSRGLQVTDEKDLFDIHGSFAVQALYDGVENKTTYFEMQDTRRVSPDNQYKFWTTNSTQKWPGQSRLQFSAIAPYGHKDKLGNPVYTKNTISFTYTAEKGAEGQNLDAEAQKDLLMAVVTKNRAETQSTNYRVPLKFRHALSAVKFAVRDVLAGEVVSIAIKDVYGTADCVYTAEDYVDSADGDDSAESRESGEFAWSNHGNVTNYYQNFNHEIKEDYNPNDPKEDLLLNNAMPEKTFMLIPQMIPDDATIEIKLKRNSPDVKSTVTLRGKIKANEVNEWLPGHEYVYTISTSSSNWVYVFDAEGNDAEGRDNIFVYSPGKAQFATLGNNADFSVKSYRYKANDMSKVEPLPWSASHGGSFSYNIDGGKETAYPEANPDLKFVTSDEWITDRSATPLKGNGKNTLSDPWEKHELTFIPHYVTTNWPGDETMQGYKHYSGFSVKNPYDLSTFGGLRTRTTANCYVVDRGGWYMFPLVYGNAIKNDKTNSSAYTSGSNLTGSSKILKTLTDYNDKQITQPYITNVNDNCRAMMIWQDAYNMIHNVELVRINTKYGTEYVVRFFVDSNNLQQGNAILALLDGPDGNVMWSWHIWATEHWIDKDSRLPHVYDNGNATFNTFKPNATTGIRECGDVAVSHNQGIFGPFYMAPYNLGWCDSKKVIYLQRVNNMDFVQFMPDGTTMTGRTARLPIIQQGEVIDYKYANNTYYQWGRKDPMRGYINHDSEMKAVFGNRPSEIGNQGSITIGKSIRTPQIFYGNKGVSKTEAEDWLMKDGYLNLWNNHADISGARTHQSSVQPNNTYRNHWVHVKTVYDPSPSGYMVPNSGVFHFVHKAASTNWYGGSYALAKFEELMNGVCIDEYNYKIWGNGVADDNYAIFFSSTGNRWWTSDEGGKGGENFGSTTSYAWSNRSIITDSNGKREAYGLALGKSGEEYYLGAQFLGRRAMGRPVRAIREP